MIDWIYLITGIISVFIFVIYSIFWRCNLHRESEGKWFVLYCLIPMALLLGSMILIYFGIEGLIQN